MNNIQSQIDVVFIHSFWRSASTYFLSKFSHENTVIFDEPFHEIIQTNTLNNSEIFKTVEGDYITSHHPKNFEYFKNYFQFKNLHNFTNYNNIFKDYFGIDKNQAPTNFLKSLINEYQVQNKLCVLGFTRSSGRSLLLKENFPNSYNIFLARDPFDQFISGLQQLHNNNNFYFLAIYPIILWENRTVDAIKLFWKKYSNLQPSFHFDGTMKSLAELIKFFSYKDLEFYISSYLTTFLMAGSTAFSSADIIVYADYLGSETYTNVVEKLLNESLKLKLNFQDCCISKYPRNTRNYNLFVRILEDVLSFTDTSYLDPQWVAFLLKDFGRTNDNNHTITALVNNLREDLREKRNENSQLQDKMGYFKTEADNLHQFMQSHEQENTNLKIEVANLHQFMQSHEQENTNLKIEVANLHQHIQSREQENETSRAKIICLQSELEQSNFQANYLKNLLEDKQFEIKKLNQKLAKIEELRKESINHYQNIISTLQSQILNFQSQISKFQVNLSQYTNQVTQLKDLLFKSNERISAMETSKFWKMRKGWFYVRKFLGVSGE